MAEVVQPQLTSIPDLVDTGLSNTIDLHIASTNFNKIVNDYTQFVQMSYAMRAAKGANDPIEAQAKVFAALNEPDSELADLPGGTTSPRIEAVGYDLIELNTFLNPTDVWVRTSTNLPEHSFDVQTEQWRFRALNLATNEYRWISVPFGLSEQTQRILTLTEGAETRWSGLSGDIFGANSELVKRTLERAGTFWGSNQNESSFSALRSTSSNNTDIKSKWKGFETNDEFLYYWWKKFQTCHEKVKEAYHRLRPGNDHESDHFTELSDSIGLLGRTFEYADSTVIPFFDTTFELLKSPTGGGVMPSPVPPVVFDKLDINSKITILEGSKKVNTLFRTSMVQVLDTLSTPTKAHGENLMTDHIHWIRMSQSITTINGIVSDTLGVTFRLLSFLQIAANKQSAHNPRIEMVVENSRYEVDYLQNKINNLTDVRPTANDVLKADTTNHYLKD